MILAHPRYPDMIHTVSTMVSCMEIHDHLNKRFDLAYAFWERFINLACCSSRVELKLHMSGKLSF